MALLGNGGADAPRYGSQYDGGKAEVDKDEDVVVDDEDIDDDDDDELEDEIESRLEKKRAAAARFKERKAKRAQEQYKNSLALRDALVSAGYFEKLPDDLKAFILGLCKDPAIREASGIAGPSVFQTLFGAAPTVGTVITLGDAFSRTFKGKATLDVWLKRWKDKGIVVTFEPNKDDYLKSTYTLETLPS
jgi:hypothetical protein